MTPLPHVTIYTDGGAVPNPGTGGYGVLILYPDRRQELSGGEKDTTNNRMELTAACVALESLSEPHEVLLYTDSEYLKKGITQWIAGWVMKGWKDVKNPDLWQRLHRATQRHKITWRWVKGHAGNEFNERVDQLATTAREGISGKKSTVTPAPVVTATTTPAATFDYTIFVAVDYDIKAKTGAWAAVIQAKSGEVQEHSGAKSGTTEYELALWGALEILDNLPPTGSVTLHTDNETVQKGASIWIKGWRKNGWKNAQGKPVVHQELWQGLDAILQRRTVIWKWSAGISPRADALAARAHREFMTK